MKRRGGGNSGSIRAQSLERCGFKRIRSVLIDAQKV
jgi:tRNA A37 threonylcarbamoyladenosine dehydratase